MFAALSEVGELVVAVPRGGGRQAAPQPFAAETARPSVLGEDLLN